MAGATAELRFCNAAEVSLTVWLEPWAQEFALPRRSELLLRCTSEDDVAPWPDIEANGNLLTVWGASASRVAVFIDSIDQHSFSAEHPSPNTGSLTPRRFVEIVFGGLPEARPGGLPLPAPPPFPRWRRLRERLARLVKPGT